MVSEVVAQVFHKNALLKTEQNPQEKRDSGRGYCEIFKNTRFTEQLHVVACGLFGEIKFKNKKNFFTFIK